MRKCYCMQVFALTKVGDAYAKRKKQAYFQKQNFYNAIETFTILKMLKGLKSEY